MGEDARAEGDLLLEVALGKAIVAELELHRSVVRKISIEDTQRVELRSMVATNLISSDK